MVLCSNVLGTLTIEPGVLVADVEGDELTRDEPTLTGGRDLGRGSEDRILLDTKPFCGRTSRIAIGKMPMASTNY